VGLAQVPALECSVELGGGPPRSRSRTNICLHACQASAQRGIISNIDAETFFFIRRTRADPPGSASEPERRGTYAMALEQFEELLGAAENASPAVRPLPLFYAVSQAGRAIAAADLPDAWKLHGHGLVCSDLSPVSILELESRAAAQ
jgi:hypothetical protein